MTPPSPWFWTYYVDDTDDVRSAVHAIYRWLDKGRLISIDTETGSVDDLWVPNNPLFCRLFQIGTATESYVFDARKWHGVIHEVCEMVYNAGARVVFANCKYDLHVMQHNGWPIPRWHNIEDVIALHRLVRPFEVQHGLKPACVQEFGSWANAGQRELKQVMKDNGWSWSTVPVDHPAYWQYAGMDTSLTVQLWDALSKDGNVPLWYYEEMEYQRITYGMERRGVRVDHHMIDLADNAWTGELSNLTLRLKALGIDKPASNKAVEEALVKMGFEPEDFTPTGAAQLDKTVLKQMERQGGRTGEAASLLVNYRRYSKWRTVYARKLRDAAHGTDMVHPSINTMAARTLRSTITNPPLQTIPKVEITRNMFKARDGHVLYAVDFDSEEARILAHYSQEPELLRVFLEGDGDIHNVVANAIKIDRNSAKTLVYTKLFGAGNATIGAALGGDEALGREVNAKLSRMLPMLDDWFKSVVKQGEDNNEQYGYPFVELPNGVRLATEPGSEYKLVNYGIQGYGAQVLKRAANRLAAEGYEECIVLTVHDELLFEMPKATSPEEMRHVADIMQDDSLSIPLTCGVEGPFTHWGAKHKEKT